MAKRLSILLVFVQDDLLMWQLCTFSLATLGLKAAPEQQRAMQCWCFLILLSIPSLPDIWELQHGRPDRRTKVSKSSNSKVVIPNQMSVPDLFLFYSRKRTMQLCGKHSVVLLFVSTDSCHCRRQQCFHRTWAHG
jgi:hypothetical protein